MFRFFILFIFIFNTVFAKQQQFGFFGIVGSSDTVSFISKANHEDEKETGFGVRFGSQTQDYRTMFTLSGNSNYQSFTVEADVFLMDDMFGVPEIRPYLGGTLGYINYDEDTIASYRENLPTDTNRTYSTETNDGYYGVNFGFVFYVADNIDLDLSYHYYFIDRLEPFDRMHGVSFALHYFY